MNHLKLTTKLLNDTQVNTDEWRSIDTFSTVEI